MILRLSDAFAAIRWCDLLHTRP